ncbi:transcriptional regulator [Janthinobacterium lividum]|uniref:transcriptional regulator n=1 Tax=Janthinobacterium lividum TaxID=29581 RepID=UPI0008D97B73|nr:YdaS family helix-turn-helix protein [Janthinobacterium lividum]
MTPIKKAIAQLGGQTATARIFGVSPQATQQWSAQGRVPADYCPRIEHLLAGAVRCEELNDRVEWELIRGADLPGKSSGNSTIDHAAELRGAIAQTRLVFEGHRDAQDALEYLEQVLVLDQCAEVPAPACTPEDHPAKAGGAPAASQAICNPAINIDTSDLERATALAEQFNEMLQGWAPALAKLSDRITATMAAAAEHAAEALAAESAQLAVQAEKAAASVAARARVDPVAVLSREVFSLSNKLQQPADLTVQMMLLAELRGTKELLNEVQERIKSTQFQSAQSQRQFS